MAVGKIKAMVLAAGVGSRLDPLTTQIPKPLVPIANRPVLEHILLLLKQHGITEIVSNLHHLPEKLIEYFGDGSQLGIKLRFIREEKLSGDAGGVRTCRKFLEEDTFLVMMGDLVTDADISETVRLHKQKGALATIGLKQVEDVTQFGVAVTNKDGFITAFQEKPSVKEALSNLASTGIYILEPEVFNHIPAVGTYGFGRQLFPTLVQNGLPVLGVEICSYWSDVGTIKQYRQSNFDALEGRVQLSLPGQKFDKGYIGGGSSIHDSCDIQGQLMLGRNSRLDADVKIHGRVIIGDNCVVGKNAELTDTIIWSESSIEPNAKLHDSVIGQNCVIGGMEPVSKATVV